jgi:hypothetical protein
MPEKTEGKRSSFDHNQDRYPNIADVLTAMQQDDEIQQGPVERIEVNCLANGDATYRVWAPRAEEPVGGFLAGG